MPEIVLPPRLVAFGEALARLAERLREALAQAPESAIAAYPDTLRQHLDTLGNAIARLAQRLNATNDEVLAKPDASEADALRAAGLIEAEIDRLLEGRAAAAHIVASPLTREARRLLPAAYEHSLREILAWLDDIVPVFAAPRATLEARGLWNDDQPVLEVETCLTLTAALELQALVARINAVNEDDILDVLDELEAKDSRQYSAPGRLSHCRCPPSPGLQLLDAAFNAVWFVIQLGLLAFVIFVLLGIAISFL